ncbi:MAG: hypothetical protein ABFD97_00790 [Syntrophobacter sp.]
MNVTNTTAIEGLWKGGPDRRCMPRAQVHALFGACEDARAEVRDEALGVLLYPEVPDLPGYYIRLAASLAGARFRIGEIPVELLQVFCELIGSAGRLPDDPKLSEFFQACVTKAPPRLWSWLFEKRFPAGPFLKGLGRRVGRLGRLPGVPYSDLCQERQVLSSSHERQRRQAGKPGPHGGRCAGKACFGVRWRILRRILSERSLGPLASPCLEITLADLEPLLSHPRRGRTESPMTSARRFRSGAACCCPRNGNGIWRKIAGHLAARPCSRSSEDRPKDLSGHGILSSTTADAPSIEETGRTVASWHHAPQADVPPRAPSSFTDIYWGGVGKRKLLFWERLAQEQARELAEIVRLTEEVSTRTRRVVLSWHNASLAAAGGWGFEGFAGRFPSKDVYRDFMFSVFKTTDEIRAQFKAAPESRGSSAPAPGGSWARAFERTIIPEPTEPCARGGVGTASVPPSPEADPPRALAERRRALSMSAAVTELSAMRVRRIFAPKALHALEHLRALMDYDHGFETGRTGGKHGDPEPDTVTPTKAAARESARDPIKPGKESGFRAAENMARNARVGTEGLSRISPAASAWREATRAASALLSSDEIEAISAAAKSEWSGAVAPHQRVDLEEALAWADHVKRTWADGMALFLALAIRGQEALDSGLVSSFVIPWIDKFFISSRRRADQGYLEALFRLVGSILDDPLILFWEDTSHAQHPSLGLALEDLRARGLPFRGIGIFDPKESKRAEAAGIIMGEYPRSLLFALRPLGDSHFAGSLKRVFEQPDFGFFHDYDSSWKDNLVFIYSGTPVFSLLSVQTEMETTSPWVLDGRRRCPFGAWFRQKLCRKMRGGMLSGEDVAGAGRWNDPLWETYAEWANLL